MKRFRVLAIDDEPALLRIIKESLIDKFDVVLGLNAQDAMAAILDQKPDLIVVDNIMPGMSGLDIVRTIRTASTTMDIPVIMITALKESVDRIAAFNAGVDDFISKPFSPDELVVRVETRLARHKSLKDPKSRVTIIGNLSIDFENHNIMINQEPIHLTQIELTIIEKLVADRDILVSRYKLEKEIWKNPNSDERILDIHMATLRKKIKTFDHKIETIYGKGYIIRSLAV